MISEYSNYVKFAITNCIDAIFHEERSYKLEQAIKYLQEALDSIGETPQINEDIAVFASSFHTRLRKYYDDDYSSYLYESISNSNHSWLEILKELQENADHIAHLGMRLDYIMDTISPIKDKTRQLLRAYRMFRKEHPHWYDNF